MCKLIVDAGSRKSIINRNIYGHFSEHLGRCIYGGLFVGDDSDIPNVNGMRSDVVAALRHINIPVLRWPGGCFADEYHWMDGIGPKVRRKRMINTHWGGAVEDNSFGTHEFMELCRQLDCQPYITGNVGSGTVREMSEWVEYMTFGGISPMAEARAANGQKEPWKLKYFGVGNENWGCGGNMRPEYYADQYRRFQTYVRSYGDNKVYKIACGPNVDDYKWTETLMSIAGGHIDALSLHYYTFPRKWEDKGSALMFSEAEYYNTLNNALHMDELINNHLRIMDRYDREHKVGLIVDEWGAWYDVESGTNPGFLYQQNTMRDALIAAVTLNIFNLHCDRVVMANLAQIVNVLQAVILTEGSRMVLTPTYHVFDLYKCHQGAQLVYSYAVSGKAGAGDVSVPQLHASASEDTNGILHITAANLSAGEPLTMEADLCGREVKGVTVRTLSGNIDDHNNFDEPNRVRIRPLEVTRTHHGLFITLPACSVTEIAVE